MITIISPQSPYFIYSPNAWQYSNPDASDYEFTVKKFMGEKVRDFTVFYDGIAMCGRVTL